LRQCERRDKQAHDEPKKNNPYMFPHGRLQMKPTSGLAPAHHPSKADYD
jgi:hypothetical protein